MDINLAHLAPAIWFLAAFLALVVVVFLIRFFWRHVLKYLVHGCLGIVAIIILILVLRYFKVF
jgi:hypothetical protein